MFPSPFISSDVAPDRAFATLTKCEVVVVTDEPIVIVGVVGSMLTAEIVVSATIDASLAVVPMSTTIVVSSQPRTSAS
jgi:hypothetical protein